ncbi:hypothetical protein H4R19_004247 [Coemansia spiralis]|nr:hypothetical protein H4R19_004247 [Coemansia spiralis]
MAKMTKIAALCLAAALLAHCVCKHTKRYRRSRRPRAEHMPPGDAGPTLDTFAAWSQVNALRRQSQQAVARIPGLHGVAAQGGGMRTETLWALRAHRVQLMDRVELLEWQHEAHLQTISHLVGELREAYAGRLGMGPWYT